MKLNAILVVIGLSAVVLAAQADASPIYTTAPFNFSVNEVAGAHVPITVLGAKSLSCLLGESVTMTAPDGVETTLSVVDGICTWTPTSGGIWTFSNSMEGNAVFTVRYSLFPGTQGAGTVVDPVKIVDDAELVDLFANGDVAEGCAFTLLGPHGIDGLAIPPGYAADGCSSGVWRLVSAADGLVYGSLPSVGVVDSAKAGPNRTVRDVKCMPPFAYSGDGWCGDASATSTLTFISPGGVTTKTANCVGTGALAYELPGKGIWTVTLSYDGETLVGRLRYSNGDFVISLL